MNILAIDPGPEESSYVLVDHKYNILQAEDIKIDDLLHLPGKHSRFLEAKIDLVLVESIVPFGRIFGHDLIKTVRIEGRIVQRCMDRNLPYELIPRKQYATALIGQGRGRINDAGLKKALELRFNQKYGKGSILNSSHRRSAFAMAVWRLDKIFFQNRSLVK